jgi:hypothetical protein
MIIVTIAVLAIAIGSLMLMLLVLHAHFYVTSIADIVEHIHAAEFERLGVDGIRHSRVAALELAYLLAQAHRFVKTDQGRMFAEEMWPVLHSLAWCSVKDLVKSFIPQSIVRYTECAQNHFDYAIDLLDNICRAESPASLPLLYERL